MKIMQILLLVLLQVIGCALLCQDQSSRRGTAGSGLMYCLDEDGNVTPVSDSTGWKKKRASILQGIQEAMGPLPDMKNFPPLDPVVEETFREESYTRRKLTLQVEEGDRLSCYLLVPDKLDGMVPAILALHPTHPMGKGDTVGLSGRDNRNYGQELARLGFVVLVPDYPGFGDEADYDFSKDNYVSGSMKGIVNHKAVAEARKVYELLGAGENLLVEYPDCEHDFIPAMREEAYRFLAERLDFSLPGR